MRRNIDNIDNIILLYLHHFHFNLSSPNLTVAVISTVNTVIPVPRTRCVRWWPRTLVTAGVMAAVRRRAGAEIVIASGAAVPALVSGPISVLTTVRGPASLTSPSRSPVSVPCSGRRTVPLPGPGCRIVSLPGPGPGTDPLPGCSKLLSPADSLDLDSRRSCSDCIGGQCKSRTIVIFPCRHFMQIGRVAPIKNCAHRTAVRIADAELSQNLIVHP